ncbi:MAG TPA: sigma 54-interacting transcriptional regulator [Kofleriaceae bacterium]
MPRRTTPWLVVPALLALAYAIAVDVVAWRAPDKGFQAFTGQRIIDIEPGGIAEQAGLREGDVIVAVDAKPITGTLDYAFRVLGREPGETVAFTVDRAGERREATVTLQRSPPPWTALVATLIAGALVVIGLFARLGRPHDLDTHRFYRTTAINAVVFVGALSWSKLVIHPVLAIVFLTALFVGPPLALDMSLDFPHREGNDRRKLRRISMILSGALGIGAGIALGFSIAQFGESDTALRWLVICVAGQVTAIPIYSALGLWSQIRAHRKATGEYRAQLRWLLFGHALTALPGAAAIPLMVVDLDRFLLVRYQVIIICVVFLWSIGYGLAILRIRLADVDSLIKSSVGYAVTTTAAVLVYLGVVLAAGWITGALVSEAGPLPHLVAGVAAAIVFGPIRTATTNWLDRRFFRDRRHYIEALRRAGESLALLREPGDLAREAVEQIVAAVRAEGGALFVQQQGAWTTAHAVGTMPAPPNGAGPPSPPAHGIVVPVTDPRTGGEPAWLVLGPRKSGDLYSTDDKHLLAALASQLAVGLANARSYGQIKTLSRTLEAQNVEIRELRDKLEDENEFLRKRVEAATEGATLVGDSKALRELRKTIERVAKSDASLLLLGESGTGKGLLARLLHATSARADQPFMQVDCGAIAASVFESELFGHERGAFTGASRMRRGPIELAHGGTLFLDEIGELPLELQPKLLRVLEDKVVLRVGATQPVAVDVRIIAATNRKLEQMVAKGEFREDLYFRLRVVEITVPPLRERRADLPALCESLLPRVARRAGYAVKPIADDALARMMAYAWPGNVRELENVLERALVLGEGREIVGGDLELSDRAPLIEPVQDEESKPHDAVMDEIERRRLSAALAAAEGNQSHAAKALGMPRTTFINKLRRHGLL